MSVDPVTAIRLAYAELSAAFRRKDLAALDAIISDDWSGASGGQPVTRSELMANVRGMFETMENIDWPRAIVSVRVDGARLIVRSSGVFRAVRHDESSVEMPLTNDDTWEMRDGRWQNVESKAVNA